jgi:hypothetical protein
MSKSTNSETRGSDHVLVEIRDAEVDPQSLLAETTTHQQIILKVDCEGSEREFFRRLSPDIRTRIDAILLDWHHPEILSEIRQKLKMLGVQLLIRLREKVVEMLYAFRK